MWQRLISLVSHKARGSDVDVDVDVASDFCYDSTRDFVIIHIEDAATHLIPDL
jgi:hypothetical protein